MRLGNINPGKTLFSRLAAALAFHYFCIKAARLIYRKLDSGRLRNRWWLIGILRSCFNPVFVIINTLVNHESALSLIRVRFRCHADRMLLLPLTQRDIQIKSRKQNVGWSDGYGWSADSIMQMYCYRSDCRFGLNENTSLYRQCMFFHIIVSCSSLFRTADTILLAAFLLYSALHLLQYRKQICTTAALIWMKSDIGLG